MRIVDRAGSEYVISITTSSSAQREQHWSREVFARLVTHAQVTQMLTCMRLNSKYELDFPQATILPLMDIERFLTASVFSSTSGVHK